MLFIGTHITFHPFTNDHLVQVLRNAGSKVKLLIARDITKDNHLSSPVLNQDSFDSKVCALVLSACVCVKNLSDKIKYNLTIKIFWILSDNERVMQYF